MYVEPVRSTVDVKPVSKPQPHNTGNVIQMVSKDGKTEQNTVKEQTTAKAASEKVDVIELQAAETEKIKEALEKITAELPNADAKFGIHEATNRVTIKLVDKETQEVIREFPPEKTLDMIAKCMEIAGVLVDEKL